jgi:hypothetical protein
MRPRALAILIVFVATVQAAEPPTISYLSPLGITLDQRMEWTVTGKGLTGAKVWTTLEPQPKFEPSDDDSKRDDVRQVKLQLPKSTLQGIHGLRVIGPAGVSNLKLFVVDNLRTEREAKEHATIAQAQTLDLPVAIEAAAEREAYDYYTFTANKHQQLTFEIVARRLGSPFDGMIRLLDARGHELYYCDDDVMSGADSRFTYQFAEAGQFFLEVRDSRYEGSKEHRYRLRVGDYPLTTTPLTNDGGPSETEPNDSPQTATLLERGGAMTGSVNDPNDRDWYRFAAKKGERLSILAHSRSLGTPTHLRLRLTHPEGNMIASADDDGIDEPVIEHVFDADGEYRLEASELLHQGGGEYTYRIELLPSPGYRLAADSDRYNAPPGGMFTAKVTVRRNGYEGPIELQVVGDDADDWKLEKATIEKGKKEAAIRVTLPKNAKPGDVLWLRLIGTANVDGKQTSVPVNTLEAVRSQIYGVPYPPASLTQDMVVGVTRGESNESKKGKKPDDNKSDEKKPKKK